jgi:predicted TIM-barrel fold metal-dependent hydrolase
MIVDCHTHINYYQDETQPALPSVLDKLQTTMRRNRVDFSLVLSSYKVSPGRPSTRDLVHALRDTKNIRVVAGISLERNGPEDLAEVREYIQGGMVKGLKFYCGYQYFYPHSPEMAGAIALAEEFGIPLMVHCGDTYSPKGKLKYAMPIHIDELAVDHPGLNIVICHLGNPWQAETAEIAYKNKNVYTDISGLVLGSFSDRFEKYMLNHLQNMLLYGVEPDNVLYGTDWPICEMESYLAFIENLKIPADGRAKIMYKNAMRLFKLDERDSPYYR